MALTLSPRKVKVLLKAMVLKRHPLLITGMPGIGKTSVVYQVADELTQETATQYDVVVEHPAVSDPTDYKGIPMLPLPGEDTGKFVALGNLALILKATNPTIYFFDDLGQATPAVQAACMQLFLARHVNGHKIPDCVTFVGATNRRQDRAGVSGILEPVKSRFKSIVEMAPDLNDSCAWMLKNGKSTKMVAFLRYRGTASDGGLLAKFEPSADLTNSPLPRTWENASDVEELGLPEDIEAVALAGAVGPAAAQEYLAFRALYGSIVNIDHILADPTKAKIPTRPDQIYATVVGLAGRANVNNFDRIATYALRMATEAKLGEFGALLVRDAVRKDDAILNTSAYISIQCGPIGDLIAGKVD